MNNVIYWNIEKLTGYKPITTFYQDFTIADFFGTDAINDTFNRAFDEWKESYQFLTELVMVLNWKIYEHYKTNRDYSQLYSELWSKADSYATENLKNEEADYFYNTTN